MGQYVEVTRVGSVAKVELQRPRAYNTFNLDLTAELADELITLSADPKVRAVVLCGQGKAFCAGGDLKWVMGWEAGPAPALYELVGRLHQAVREIRRMPKAVIAAIDGVAAGAGLSMALDCDFRVMGAGVSLHQSFTSAGLSIDGGGTFSLPRLVGLARALEIAAFDQPISARQALEWGLVTKVVDNELVMDEAMAMAANLAKRSVHAFGLVKKLMTDSYSSDLETHLERERSAVAAAGGHADGIEGMTAFSEKRKPVFI